MTKVARYMKFTAKPGEADRLAALLLSAADDLADVPGCELYLVNRQSDESETVWVTELWRSQVDVDAGLAAVKDDPKVAQVMSLVVSAERIDLEPLGGKSPG